MIGLRSIRARLALWYAGVLAVSLIGFGAALYGTVRFSLHQNMDRMLDLQAAGLTNAVRSFREAERAKDPAVSNWQPGPIVEVPDLLKQGKIEDLIFRWAQKTQAMEVDLPVRVLDRRGEMIVQAQAPGFAGLYPSGLRDSVEKASHGKPVHRTIGSKETRFRWLTYPVIEKDRLLYFIQIGVSLNRMDEILGALRMWLLILIPVISLAGGLVGVLLVARVFSPIGRMIRQADQISGQALDKRMPVPATGDEVERLARTFNAMLDRVERNFRRLRQFSAAASHELRTPLTALRGELELLLRRPRSPEAYREVLTAQLETVKEMSVIVEELLALARSDATGLAEMEPVELRDLVDHLTGAWKRLAAEKRIDFRVEAARPVWVLGERRLLDRLIANLLDNAIRHTPARGKVTLRVDYWRDRAGLFVQDSGSGIPAQEIPKLFDRFFKPSFSPHGSDSTGLGLGLCRWIAEVHRGRIEVSSPSGEGALFIVWLPLLKVSA
ncbi:MAG: hypothetical protein COV76_04905 [Candidatus Omnitrophica bacterium CG11_big_fil_rev_8_21_14_0_20_64_10]|nr:MAG: hypothetical protein COV76_04905 [Candidatus Omnitrophica bacterium CG11_big_fil_rev_8_21_14_0_20_64_10]